MADEIITDGDADNIITDGNEDPQHPLWNAPVIKLPTSTTVSPGFTIMADTDAGTVPEAWTLEIMIGPTLIKKVDFGREWTGVWYVVPKNLIPSGAGFYFKVDYRIMGIWSRWAWSGNLTMDMTHQPPQPPRFTDPRPGSQHSAGLVIVKGTCSSGAAVRVLDFYNIKLGDATVRGTTWEYSHNFNVGMQFIRASQTVSGEDSGPSDPYIFTTIEAPPAPVMMYPLEGSTNYQFVVPMRGTCKRGARVEVLNKDGSSLGFAKTQDQPGNGDIEWSFDYYWTVGTWQVRARQIAGDAVSAPTELRTFHVK